MTFQVVFAFALLSAAFGCSTVPGDYIIQNPSFQFSFSPPVSWTYGANTTTMYPGQTLSASDAQRMMTNSINNAIYSSVNRLGYSTVGMTWTTSGYTPIQAVVIADGSTLDLSNTYVPARGAVIQKRGPKAQDNTYPKEEFIQRLTISVRGTAVYTKSQWQNLADQVLNYLSIYEKVYFRSEVTIS